MAQKLKSIIRALHPSRVATNGVLAYDGELKYDMNINVVTEVNWAYIKSVNKYGPCPVVKYVINHRVIYKKDSVLRIELKKVTYPLPHKLVKKFDPLCPGQRDPTSTKIQHILRLFI